MRKIALISIAAAIVAVVSGSLVAASHKTNEGRTTSIDPTEITLKTQNLAVVQVNEPF